MAGLENLNAEKTIASFDHIHPEDEDHQATVCVRIPKGEICEYVVWDWNKTYGKGGRSNGNYYNPVHYLGVPSLKVLHNLPTTEKLKAVQAAKVEALAEFARRVSNQIRMHGGIIKED